MALHQHILIESVSPSVDGGLHMAKSVAGQPLIVEADIFRDGHAVVRGVVKWRKLGEMQFEEIALEHVGNDRFRGSFPLGAPGRYQFTIEGWTDQFASWRDDFAKKVAANRPIELDLEDGIALLARAEERADVTERGILAEAIARLRGLVTPQEALALVSNAALAELVYRLDPREDGKVFEPVLGVFAVPKRAAMGAWYEFFPRSETSDPARGATLREAEHRLPRLAELGFEVLYIAPVHPIGVTHRKGKNDGTTAAPGEPGCPWAIGGPAGGHTAIEPALGTLDDFDHFVATAYELGMQVALDFAIQCSPDHPWIKEHPAWFEHRSDGSIRCAENPPNEYPDVCRIDFDTDDRTGLYIELYRVVMFWVARGVTIFRVDNPHTKPVAFWEWLITKVHGENPNVIFLAEAFTRPKMMKALAKAGFTQSYTYFTWRNTKLELEEYMTELTQTEMRHYFTPNFFANTHDVLPEFLQKGGRPAFEIRLILAATLAPSYGIYSGYELCENEALHGKEEYENSEKFEIKPRDYEAPGNLNGLIADLNRIRRENAAFHELANVQFFKTDSEHIIVYAKSTADRSSVVLVAVNLDPFAAHHAHITVPLAAIGVPSGNSFEVSDLLTGARYTFSEKTYVRLDPATMPAHILLLENDHGREK
jgi:starch synthase (maltosyl-transferring)